MSCGQILRKQLGHRSAHGCASSLAGWQTARQISKKVREGISMNAKDKNEEHALLNFFEPDAAHNDTSAVSY
jgi:hypothetical protein